MFLLGTLVNAGAVLVSTLVGSCLRRGFPKRIQEVLTQAIALLVLYLGVDGIVSYATSDYAASAGSFSMISVMLSLALGSAIGTILGIDRGAHRLGAIASNRIGGKNDRFARGFVDCSLIFCIGAMSVIGEIRGGLFGDHRMIYLKSAMDSVVGLTMASSLGVGCALSAGSILLYQGLIATVAYASRHLVASAHSAELAGLTTAEASVNIGVILQATPAVNQMGLVGSCLLLGLGLNLLGVTKLKLADMIPAMFLPFLFCLIPFFR